METTNEYIELIQRLNFRIDELEKLIKLLLINNLVDDTNCICQSTGWEIDSGIKELIKQHKLKTGELDNIGEIRIMNVIVPRNVSITIKDVIQINTSIKTIYPDIEPVFQYETINGMQRKRILQENISFGVKDKELHIFAPRRRNK